MSVTGSFNNSGSPVIDIAVSGPVTKPTKFTAMVDTGFSGFLLLPILEAFPVGLILRGTIPITLADGTSQTKLTCLEEIHFEGKSEIGLIIIEWQSTDVLVGMDFLRKFKRKLVVDAPKGIVKLIKSNPAAAPAPPTPPASVTVPAGPAPPDSPQPANTTENSN
jgi:predicted aspartyl protease